MLELKKWFLSLLSIFLLFKIISKIKLLYKSLYFSLLRKWITSYNPLAIKVWHRVNVSLELIGKSLSFDLANDRKARFSENFRNVSAFRSDSRWESKSTQNRTRLRAARTGDTEDSKSAGCHRRCIRIASLHHFSRYFFTAVCLIRASQDFRLDRSYDLINLHNFMAAIYRLPTVYIIDI